MSKLIPPDVNQCQAEKPNGENFMTLGGGHRMIRCTNKPLYIAKETAPGPDGEHGSMSVCAECTPHMIRILPVGSFALTLIE